MVKRRCSQIRGLIDSLSLEQCRSVVMSFQSFFRSSTITAFVYLSFLLSLNACKKQPLQGPSTPTPSQSTAGVTNPYLQMNCLPSGSPATLPFQQGWYGADGDVSVQIGNDQSVWLFDDTLVSASSRSAVNQMPRNSAGAFTCSGIQYAWGNSSSKTSATSFLSTGGSEFYWFADAAYLNGKVYASMMIEGAGSGFPLDGMALATISNPSSTPSAWNINTSKISTSISGSPNYTGAALTPDENSSSEPE